jgi:hypothetical protein
MAPVMPKSVPLLHLGSLSIDGFMPVGGGLTITEIDLGAQHIPITPPGGFTIFSPLLIGLIGTLGNWDGATGPHSHDPFGHFGMPD